MNKHAYHALGPVGPNNMLIPFRGANFLITMCPADLEDFYKFLVWDPAEDIYTVYAEMRGWS